MRLSACDAQAGTPRHPSEASTKTAKTSDSPLASEVNRGMISCLRAPHR